MFNIMGDYINLQKNHINNCMRLLLGENYNKNISNIMLKRYINVRYLNNDLTEKHKFFYRRIYFELQKEAEKLTEEFSNLAKVIDSYLKMFQYIFYLDGVRNIEDIDAFAQNVFNKRKKMFPELEEQDFEKKLIQLIKENSDEKVKFFKTYETQDFELSIAKYTLVKGIYEVDIKRKFKISYVYSDKVIDEVFNEKVVNEDKLMIEYLMLSAKCVEEIINGDFDTKYFVNFPISIFEKEKKKKQVLNILENQSIQEKINLKISYKDFVTKKEEIYEMIRNGYKFAIILDDSFEINDENVKKLEIFNYILVDKNNEEIFKYRDKKNNIIINET